MATMALPVIEARAAVQFGVAANSKSNSNSNSKLKFERRRNSNLK